MSSKLEDRLYNYQAEPPAAAWDAIAAALDDAPTNFAERLCSYQQIPDIAVWEKIDAALHTAPIEAAQEVPIHKYKKTLRYAAAAVLLVCIAGAGYFINSNQTSTAGVTKIEKASILKTIKAAAPVPPVLPTLKVEDNTADIDVAYARPQYAALTVTPAPIIKKVVAAKKSYVVLPKKELAPKEAEVVPPPKPLINTAQADRYMVATTVMGNAVRVPKKVYSAFACNDESMMNTKACLDNLALLQHKMSATLATDFAGFLDLLKNLQENSK